MFKLLDDNLVHEMIAQWDYHSSPDKLQKIMDIYYNLCKQYKTEPLRFE